MDQEKVPEDQRAYEAPSISDLGTIEDITGTGGTGSTNDGKITIETTT